MNKHVVLKIGKIEDIKRDKMYYDYLSLLAEKKQLKRKCGDTAAPKRLALK